MKEKNVKAKLAALRIKTAPAVAEKKVPKLRQKLRIQRGTATEEKKVKNEVGNPANAEPDKPDRDRNSGLQDIDELKRGFKQLLQEAMRETVEEMKAGQT